MSEIIRPGCPEWLQAKELRDRLDLQGDIGMVRKLDALLSQSYLKGHERAKLLKYIGKL